MRSGGLVCRLRGGDAPGGVVRGPFRFGNNNMPVQNYYAFETSRAGGKVLTRLIGTPLTSHADPYAPQCKLP